MMSIHTIQVYHFSFFSFRFHVKEMSLFGPNVKIKLREQHMYQMHHWGALCLRVCVCVCVGGERDRER